MMNCERGFLHSVGFWSAPVCRSIEDPRGACHWGASSCHRLHMRGGPSRLRRLTTRDLVTSLILRPSRSSFSAFIKQCLLMLALWSCGRRGSVVQAQRQIHRVFLPACLSPNRFHRSSPFVDCSFDTCRTSHSV